MTSEFQDLINAIVSLKKTPSFWSDYVFPFIPAVLTTIIGFFIASYNFKRQESMKADAKKIEDANKFVVQMESALQSLVSLKGRYQEHINTNPLSRAFSFGEVKTYFPVITGVEGLVFLSKGNELKNGEPYYASWNNVPRINAMVGNYIYLLDRLSDRNKLREQIDAHFPVDENGGQHVNITELEPQVKELVRRYVNETEVVLSMVDGLILEFISFMSGIKGAIEKSVDTKRIKHLSILLSFNYNNPIILKALEPIPNPDYKQLSQLLNMREEFVKHHFNSGYI